MSDELDDRVRRNLGPATERLFEQAFRDSVLITAGAAAKLLGINETTLSQSTLGGLIGSTMISAKTRRYSERDLRIYLTSGRTAPVEASQNPYRRVNSVAVAPRGLGFTARRKQKP